MGSITSDNFCENQQDFNWLGLFRSVVGVLPSLWISIFFPCCCYVVGFVRAYCNKFRWTHLWLPLCLVQWNYTIFKITSRTRSYLHSTSNLSYGVNVSSKLVTCLFVIFKKLVSILFPGTEISCGCCWLNCNIFWSSFMWGNLQTSLKMLWFLSQRFQIQ